MERPGSYKVFNPRPGRRCWYRWGRYIEEGVVESVNFRSSIPPDTSHIPEVTVKTARGDMYLHWWALNYTD